jgi:hypothetical protein
VTALAAVLAGLVVLAAVLVVMNGDDDAKGRTAAEGAGTASAGAQDRASAGASTLPRVLLEQPNASVSSSAASSPTSKASPTRLPGLHPAPRRPHVRLPARPASADGRLVAGYPSGVVPVPPRSRVRSSSVSAQGGRVQGTLVASYAGSRAGLHAYYRRVLARVGLTGARVPALAPARATAYSDGVDTVTLTDRPVRAGRVPFSLVMTLQAGR